MLFGHTRSRNFHRLLLGDVGFLQSSVGASFESAALAGRPWVGGFSLGWWVYWLLSSMSLPIFISSTFPLADEIPNGVEWRDRQCSTGAASHLPSSQLLEPPQHYPSLWSHLCPWAATSASLNKTGIIGWRLGGEGGIRITTESKTPHSDTNVFLTPSQLQITRDYILFQVP